MTDAVLPDPARLALLRRMPIFHGLRDDTLLLLLRQASVAEVPAGEHFFLEGDAALHLYVLESGLARVHRRWQGREVEVATLQPGDAFGDMALIDPAPRNASVRAVRPSRALEISPLQLQLVHDHDVEQFIAIQANLARELCRRLRLADARQLAATPPAGGGDGLDWPQLLSW